MSIAFIKAVIIILSFLHISDIVKSGKKWKDYILELTGLLLILLSIFIFDVYFAIIYALGFLFLSLNLIFMPNKGYSKLQSCFINNMSYFILFPLTARFGKNFLYFKESLFFCIFLIFANMICAYYKTRRIRDEQKG